MKRNIFCAGLFVILLTVSIFSSAQKKPNIVVIVADDLGWNDVGFHNPAMITPNLNALVREGVELQRFYVRPICSPTRAGLMTGKYADRVGITGVISPRGKGGLPVEEQTLADLLATAGYKNRGAFGKWHLGHSDIKYHPLRRGFTTFYGHYNGAIDYYTHFRNGALDWHNGYKLSRDTGYSIDLVAKQVVQFIDQSAKEPFFAYIALNAPHAPLQGKEADLKLYGYDPSKPIGDYDGGGDQENEYNTVDYGQKGRGNTARQTYSAMVTTMDRAVGDILKALKKAGVSDNTIIWFTSDNGGATHFSASNIPLRGEKQTEWEGGVRVVSAVYWKGKWEGGKKNANLIGYIDLFPTIAAITGATMKGAVDGINVTEGLTGKTLPERMFYLGKEAVVTPKWKLINGELYDLEKDISETTNLAAQQPGILLQLQTALTNFKKIRIPSQFVMRPANWRPQTWDITAAEK